ncbi:MAG: hypothetical protein GQ574_14155 [Crocinitomix sp.]|nr:hypothetical protein [Crocinitomix sp.]
MSIKILSILSLLILIACNSSIEPVRIDENLSNTWSQEPYLVHPDTIYSIDLSNLSEVAENLNGYWVKDHELNGESILWLTYSDSILSSFWTHLEFNELAAKNKSVGLPTCQQIGILFLIDDTAHVEFGIGGSDSIQFKEMTNARFSYNGETYLRHIGP